jgi:hypothetical protein
MASAMAEVASVLRYSSTTNTPATSPLKEERDSPFHPALPIQVPDDVLSVSPSEAIPEPAALLTVNKTFLVDALYLATIVNHEFCTSAPDDVWMRVIFDPPADALKEISKAKSLEPALHKSRLLSQTWPREPKSMNISSSASYSVKRTTATIVRPPFVAIFKVRGPALRN